MAKKLANIDWGIVTTVPCNVCGKSVWAIKSVVYSNAGIVVVTTTVLATKQDAVKTAAMLLNFWQIFNNCSVFLCFA